jgi:hypothetical protein
MLFDANRLRKNISHVFETEDAEELRRILGQGYHAVVGNPPYINVPDAALRDAYRARYRSCHGKYSLSVPFMERFFELARPEIGERSAEAGNVGMITTNSFMKREFGLPLVEQFLPTVDVTTLIDTSGVSIPGHSTPTVIVFGRSREPVSSHIRVLDAVRGRSGPADPSGGPAWRAILELIDQPGRENRYIRASDVEREEFATHPMTLGIGRELRKTLERGRQRMGDVAEALGITAVTGEDDLYCVPTRHELARAGVAPIADLVIGTQVRDWTVQPLAAVWTYDDQGEPHLTRSVLRWLWPARAVISRRRRFGTPMLDRGLTWFEWQELYWDKLRTPLTITHAFVATHNHFVLDRGGRVFKQTAPVIKLHAGADDEQHLRLLAVLNSSVACWWFMQVCQPKTVPDEAWANRYEHNSTNVADLPLPSCRPLALPHRLDALARKRASLLDELADAENLDATVHALALTDGELFARLISLQEELDWQVLAAYRLVPEDLLVLGLDAPPLELGQRAFEIVLAGQVAAGEVEPTWFERHGSTPITEPPAAWPADYRAVVEQRIALIEGDSDIGLIERPEHKRRWVHRPWQERQSDALRRLVLEALEDPKIWEVGELRSVAQLTDALRTDHRLVEALELLASDRDAGLGATVELLVLDAAVPHLAALRFNEKGLRKRTVWEQVWELQRSEDRIDARIELPESDPDRLTPAQAQTLKSKEVGVIPVPPRYAQADFRSVTSWKHRGKLDVPKERFVLYPDAGRGADLSPVLGWAGWDERDRARALAARIIELREQAAADAERLAPLLAGIEELLPWIHQWHPEIDAAYGGPPGAFFESWLDQQLVELSLTRDALCAWRPPESTRGRQRRVTA